MKRLSRAVLTTRNFSLEKQPVVLSLIVCAAIATVLWSSFSLRKAGAASPPSGVFGPAGPRAPFMGTSTGTATRPAAHRTQADCGEGRTCDTLPPTVAPGGYTRKP